MKLRIKSKSARYVLIATAATLLPLTGFAKPKPIMTTDILEHLREGEPWDRSVLASTKMVMFQQSTTTSGGTNATSIAKVTLKYFTTTNCTAASGTAVPTYTTPGAISFTISLGRAFGLVAASAWTVGNSKVSPTVTTAYPQKTISDILSIAVTFHSTASNTPQASFATRSSFACVPVTCSGGQCTSSSGTQSFQLKTTTAIGDPADGGVIACKNGGLNNLVTPTADNSVPLTWGPSGTFTSSASATDGAANTTSILARFSSTVTSYAAKICSTYSAGGGFTSGWFLPSGGAIGATVQLNCLYTNRIAIGGFTQAFYWSSNWTASGANAFLQQFTGTTRAFADARTYALGVRCARAFTP